jgi:hypothetical protein
MIHLALRNLAQQLNQYLVRSSPIGEDLVMVAAPVGLDGPNASDIENKILLFLTRIERDTAPFRSPDTLSRGLTANPPMYLNLYVMIAASFTGKQYIDGVKYIASVISYFQQNAIIDRRNSPDLDKGIDKLILDLENMSQTDMSNVWGTLGGRYLPSVLYRVRMVTIDGGDIQGRAPTVIDPNSGLGTPQGLR